MSKALVIKGADFETNRVAVIQFEGDHTTSVTLSENTLSFDEIGSTKTLICTLTPSDSVDPVIWSTSDGDVATVVNGLVTAIGMGECTITAASGSYSATCTVSVEAIYLSGIKLTKTLTDPNQSGNNQFTRTICDIGVAQDTHNGYITLFDVDEVYGDNLICANMCKNVAVSGYDYQIILPNEFENDTNQKRIYENVGGYPKPIKLPSNSTKVKCIGLSNQYGARAIFFKTGTRALDTNENVNGQAYYMAWRQKYTPTASDYTWVYQNNLEFEIPEGYDGVVIVWKTDPSDETAVLPVNMTAEQLATFKVQCL